MPKTVNLRDVHVRVFPPGAATQRIDRLTKYGNPYKIGEQWFDEPMDRGDVILRYAAYLARKVVEDPEYLEPLRGADLACWCAPLPCHGDIILMTLDGGLTALVGWINYKLETATEIENNG